MDNEKNSEKKQTTEELLGASGVSSESQQDAGFFRKFVDSSVFWVIVFEAFLLVFFSVFSPSGTFATTTNLFNIAFNASQIMLLSVGLTYVITSGYFDNSVGMVLIVTSVVSAKAFKAVAGTPEEIAEGLYPHMGLGIFVMILVAVLLGALCGAVNGFFTTTLRLDAFIGTLGSMYIFQGAGLVISNGTLEKGLPRDFQTYFGHAKLFGLIPYPLIMAVAVGLFLLFIMKRTRFGVYVRAVGSNEQAAKRAGIKVAFIRYMVFVLMGILCSLAGMIDVFRFATTNPSGHITDSMMAIMASVMGGTSMSGGKPSIEGAIIGSLIPVTLQMGMVVLRINSYYQYIAMGIFVVIAVYLDILRNKKTN